MNKIIKDCLNPNSFLKIKKMNITYKMKYCLYVKNIIILKNRKIQLLVVLKSNKQSIHRLTIYVKLI